MNFDMESCELSQKIIHRIEVTKLRISAHKLHIKHCRSWGTLRQDRICLRRTCNEIEDEVHF